MSVRTDNKYLIAFTCMLGTLMEVVDTSVANVSQLVALDRAALTERVGRVSASSLELILAGIDVVLGRS